MVNKKTWTYLYQVVDAGGHTLEFLLRPTRDAEAAHRCFLKALGVWASLASQACFTYETETSSYLLTVPQFVPRIINVDKKHSFSQSNW